MDLSFAWNPDAGWEAPLAALFLVLLFLVPVSLGAGVFLLVVVGADNPYLRLKELLSRFLAWTWRGGREAAWSLVWRSLAVALYLPLSFTVAYVLCRILADEVATARFQALLSVLATLGTLVGLLPVPVFVAALGRRLHLAAGVRVVRTLFARPLYPLVVEALALIAFAVLFVVKMKVAIEASPWRTPAVILAGVLAGVVLAAQTSRLTARLVPSVISGLVLLALVLGSAAGALSLKTTDTVSHGFIEETRAARWIHHLLAKALDRDGDGYMHGFAGGDCAPDDPGISPAAVDIPGNGIDEDCDGYDTQRSTIEAGRWDFDLPEQYPTRKLPVILITDDALSANHVSFMGYQRKTTRNLDALSEQCFGFGKAFSQGPSTRLSLGSAFTGVYDTQVLRLDSRRVPHPLAPENLTLAEAFQQAGWDTVAVVPNRYFHARWRGLLQGFQYVDKSASRTRKVNDEDVHNAPQLTDAALEQIRKKRTKPLFLWVHYYDNHPPFSQPEGAPSFGTSRRDIYDAEVAFADEAMGRLFEGVEEAFAEEGYLMIVSADHGSSFDERHPARSHGYDLHTSVLHIPMLFCSRFIEPGWDSESPVALIDIFPTLANLHRLPVRTPLEGTSLVPLLFKGESWPKRNVYHQFLLPEKVRKGEDPLYAASVRDSQYNLIWDRKNGRRMLFDYGSDPFEENDLAASLPKVVRKLDSSLKSWLVKVYMPTEQQHAPDESPEDTNDGDYVDHY